MAGIGTLVVATSVGVSNYWARLMYDVSSAFDSEPWLKWALPLMVLGGLLILVLLLFGLWRCWKGGAKPVGKGGSKISSARVTPA